MGLKKILVIGDGVVPTGFSTVVHNIISNIDATEYDVHHLAVNYRGDPHPFPWSVYPAQLGGDFWGFGRIRDFVNLKIDGIFILNDVWVINNYLDIIKKEFKEKIPPIVVYFPVDSMVMDKEWFKHFDIVNKAVVYTQFGYNEVEKVIDKEKIAIVPHGIDNKTFYKIDLSKEEIKKKLYPIRSDFIDSFIVLNANRNQPRKRIDITLEGFKLFSEGKPDNVKVYMHMGTKDVGWDIIKYSTRLGIDDRLIVTNTNQSIQAVTTEKLNLIYNACDVGLNTGLGEGWSLTNMEHGVTGAAQIVPNHSALTELYTDCGILIPVDRWLVNQDTLTVSGLVRPEHVAEGLQLAYDNKEEKLLDLGKKTLEKFTSKEYNWKNIVKDKWNPILKEVYG